MQAPGQGTLSAQEARERVLAGGLFAALGQAIKVVVELSATIVLARLLAPEQFGQVAMVGSVMTLGHLLQDGGLSSATIQAPELGARQLATTFWVQVGVGCALGALFALSSPVLGAFYGVAALVPIGWAMSLAFPLRAVGAQALSLLARDMRMDLLLVLDVVTTLTAAGLGVYWAWTGWGVWALVGRHLMQPMASLVLLTLLGRIRPRLQFSAREARGLLRFGKDVSLYNLLNYFARNLDDILIGRFWGGAALGLYQRAYQLATLPLTHVNAPMGRVATPALSRLMQDAAAYRRTYASLLSTTLTLTMPVAGVMAAAAGALVRVVLGERWVGATPILVALSVLMFTQPIGHSTGWLFVSQGRSRDMLRWGVLGSGLSVGSFLIGLPFGPTGVAWSYALSSLCVRLPLLLHRVGESGPVRAADVYRCAAWPLGLGVACFAGTRAVLWLLRDASPLQQCLGAAAVGLLAAATLGARTPFGQRLLRPLWRRARQGAVT